VIVAYFDRKGTKVDVHPIRIGPDGEFVNVPSGYRSFFLQEQRRLFGVQ
jgi:ribosomal protein L9